MSEPKVTLTTQLHMALVSAAERGLSRSEAAAEIGTTLKSVQSLARRLKRVGQCFHAGAGAAMRMYASQHLADNNCNKTTQQRAADAFLAALTAAIPNGMSTAQLFPLVDAQTRVKELAMQQLRAAGLAFNAGKLQAYRHFARQADATDYAELRVKQRTQAKHEASQRRQSAAAAQRRQTAEAERQAQRLANQQAREQRRQQRQQQQAQAAELAAQARKRKPDHRTTLVPRDSRPGAQQVVRHRSTAAAAPVQVRPAPAATEVTYAPNYRHTVRKAPPGRFEVAPDERVIGGFSTLGPGQYLPETGFSAYLNNRR